MKIQFEFVSPVQDGGFEGDFERDYIATPIKVEFVNLKMWDERTWRLEIIVLNFKITIGKNEK